jgi:predicted nucleic acid-binding protein
VTAIVVDTSVLIDHLRGNAHATALLEEGFSSTGRLAGSVLTKLEVLAGMRDEEEPATRALLGLVEWIPVSDELAEAAGALARRYLSSNPGVDPVDYVIAATAISLDAALWTGNVRHFPMFEGLTAPY